MTDTRHLDTALAILKGSGTRRKKENIIHLSDLGAVGVSVQVDRKEVWLAPDMAQARQDAERRQTRLRCMGREYTIIEE